MLKMRMVSVKVIVLKYARKYPLTAEARQMLITTFVMKVYDRHFYCCYSYNCFIKRYQMKS